MNGQPDMGSTAPEDSWTVHQQLIFNPIPDEVGSFGLFVQHELPQDLPRFEFHLDGSGISIDVDSAWGYSFEGGQKLEWNGLTESPRAHLTLSLNSSTDGRYIDTPTWTLAQRPRYSIAPKTLADNIDLRKNCHVSGEGVVSEDANLLYFGEYDEWSTNIEGETIRLIVPEAASLSADPRDILETLVHTSVTLDVNCRNEEVVVFVAPTENVDWEFTGISDAKGAFWVQDHHRVDTLQQSVGGCAWVHEYVHTRQEFTEKTTRNMDWLYEAFASYYASLLPFRQGRIGYDDFMSYIRTDDDMEAVLTDSYTVVRPSRAPYTKGRRVLAALDCEIQSRSDGRSSLLEVFRRLNEITYSELSYAEFESLLDDLPGGPYSDWLQRYVHSPACPSIPDSRNCFGIWISGPD